MPERSDRRRNSSPPCPTARPNAWSSTCRCRRYELCRLVRVERRTLLRALQAMHATTPSRYLRALRLNLVRHALMAPHAGCTTVTEVATRFGFRELGRFAGEYREEFGESPSDTLRRSAQKGLACQ